jgi:hypothetical protein
MVNLIPVDHDPFEEDGKWPNNAAGAREAAANLAAQGPQTPSYAQMLRGFASAPGRVVNSAIDTAISAFGDPIGTAGNMIGGVISAPIHLMNAVAEDNKHWERGYHPTAAGPGLETAAELFGIGAPAAEVGAAGIFGGRLSKLADHSAIAKAERMEAAGAKPDEIWYETGTGRGADGKWRQEIDDSQTELKIKPFDLKGIEIDPNQTNRGGGFETTSYLDDVIHHPDLYKAYPHARDISVEPLPDALAANGTRGDYNASTNTIRLSRDLSAEQAKSTLLHEVQHAVQNAEGFAPGDNPANHIPAALGPARQQFEAVRTSTQNDIKNQFNTSDIGVEYMKDLIRREKFGPNAAPEVPKTYADAFRPILDRNPEIKDRLSNIVQTERILAEADQTAYENYRRAMGETESRNTQKRQDFSADQRRFTPPRLTEDVPRLLQRDPRVTGDVRLIPVDHDPFSTSTPDPAIITSQHFLDEPTVAEKMATEDYDVNLSPPFNFEGKSYQVVMDGHHSLEAAKRNGVEPSYTVNTPQMDDRVALLHQNRIDDFLQSTAMDGDYVHALTGKSVW